MENPEIAILKIKDKKIAGKLRRFGGYFLIVIGVLGILLPILPGWPFFFLGIIILGGDETTRDRIIVHFPKKSRKYLVKVFDTIYQSRN